MQKLFTSLLILILVNLILSQQGESDWETDFEKSGFVSTADYDQTMEYFQKLADNSEFAEFLTYGISPQGRELKCLVVSTDKFFTSEEMKAASKPLMLVINGIHSGEIEGKDASMILMREILITKEKEYLLDSINIIVVPIFSVDGHERKSKYNRINQNGPRRNGLESYCTKLKPQPRLDESRNTGNAGNAKISKSLHSRFCN
jgi:murein tripeptide amidase MpaA